jgi:hypothetical protein
VAHHHKLAIITIAVLCILAVAKDQFPRTVILTLKSTLLFGSDFPEVSEVTQGDLHITPIY